MRELRRVILVAAYLDTHIHTRHRRADVSSPLDEPSQGTLIWQRMYSILQRLYGPLGRPNTMIYQHRVPSLAVRDGMFLFFF